MFSCSNFTSHNGAARDVFSCYRLVKRMAERILSQNTDHDRVTRAIERLGRPFHKLGKIKEKCCFDLIFLGVLLPVRGGGEQASEKSATANYSGWA